MGIGLCVHANSLYRSEGRGKLPQEKPQWSMCKVIKVNVKDGD